jgi:phenylalanyl-tRNA synthetase beta chain
MWISYNWLKEYLDFDLCIDEVCEILTNTGLEVEAVRKTDPFSRISESLLIGQIKEVARHPDADKLSICQVDTAADKDMQIICGAPNVREGQKVLVALEGTVLENIKGEKLRIKKTKIRGVASFGMICAEDEIGLGEDHSGIMVLDDDAPTGISYKRYLGHKEDYSIEIAITPNRGDAVSHIGVARDLAAFLKKRLHYPDVDAFPEHSFSDFSIEIQDANLCPRYTGLIIKDITVKDSPDWLKMRLKAVGLKPVNNVVDISNYVMYETGQPLHAFDLDKLSGNRIVVRISEKGMKFKTLDGSEVELSGEDILICDAEKVVALGGVMGGWNSMITAQSKNLFLESACFNPAYIRKTAKRHAFNTDASYRFERGSDPEQTVYVAKRAALLLSEIGEGHIASAVLDNYARPFPKRNIRLTHSFLEKSIGAKIDKEAVMETLSFLEYDIKSVDNEAYELGVPAYRFDVERPIDLVEEFLRIYSYNKISLSHQVKNVIQDIVKDKHHENRERIFSFLAAHSFQEILTSSFAHAGSIIKIAPEMEAVLVPTLNPVNKNLDVLRPELLYSGLDVIRHNFNRNNKSIRFFEWGREYRKTQGGYSEKDFLVLWICGDIYETHWKQRGSVPDIFEIKGMAESILKLAGLENKYRIQIKEHENFSFAAAFICGDKEIGYCAKISKKLNKYFDIDKDIFFACLDGNMILNQLANNEIRYEELPMFPSIKRDMSLSLKESVHYEDIYKEIFSLNNKILSDFFIFDVYIGEGIKQGYKSYALRFVFQDRSKTLSDKQVDMVMEKIQGILITKFGVKIR